MGLASSRMPMRAGWSAKIQESNTRYGAPESGRIPAVLGELAILRLQVHMRTRARRQRLVRILAGQGVRVEVGRKQVRVCGIEVPQRCEQRLVGQQELPRRLENPHP